VEQGTSRGVTAAAAATAARSLPDRPEMPEGADPFPRWPVWFGAAGYAVGVGAGIVSALMLMPALAVTTWGFGVDTDDSLPVVELLATLFQDLGWVIAAIVLAGLVCRPRAWHFGFSRPRLGPAVGWSLVAILAYVALTLAYTLILQPDSGDPIQTGDRYGTLIGSCVIIIVVAPLTEEIFFRGFLYRILRGRMGLWPALVINGALFGAIHLTSGGPLAVALIAPLGFLLCLIYERSGSLYPCIALHALNNALVSAAEFERVTGIALLMGAGMLLLCLIGALSMRGSAAPRVRMVA
jgi:membrane protease YdiL (CAAX protease family)